MKKSFISNTVLSFVWMITMFQGNPLNAQESSDSSQNLKLELNADLVSRYIWRGLPSSLSPNIQPYATLSYKNFAAQVWGSYALPGQYAEIDLNLSYTLGAFTFSIWDYYNEDESDLSLNDYFRWSNTDTSYTAHSLEGGITFNGTESFPISFTLATFFYGNDIDEEGDNYYSTYLELGYESNIGETNLSLFAGGTFAKGYYASKAAVVNLGFTASRELKLSNTMSLPVYGSLILNPDAKNIFFVFGITF